MSDRSDEIAGDDSDEIVGDDVVPVAVVVRAVAPRAVPRQRILRAFLIVSTINGLWEKWPADDAAPEIGPGTYVLGVLLAETVVNTCGSPAQDDHHNNLRGFASRLTSASTIRGSMSSKFGGSTFRV
jgi:hypothetical protein